VSTSSVASDAAERLRRRYPTSRVPRPLKIVAVGVLAVVFLSWLIWTATVHANPVASGDVESYAVLSDREIAVTVVVDRPDPSIAVVCNVVAQAADFQSVGAMDRLEVPPRAERLVNLKIVIKTFRRATTASVKSCALP
jgi:hypothetical protein